MQQWMDAWWVNPHAALGHAEHLANRDLPNMEATHARQACFGFFDTTHFSIIQLSVGQRCQMTTQNASVSLYQSWLNAGSNEFLSASSSILCFTPYLFCNFIPSQRGNRAEFGSSRLRLGPSMPMFQPASRLPDHTPQLRKTFPLMTTWCGRCLSRSNMNNLYIYTYNHHYVHVCTYIYIYIIYIIYIHTYIYI